jgi:hypothetical protein
VGYEPVDYDEPVVNDNIIAATPYTNLDLAEQQLIESSVSDGLFELPRPFVKADLADGIFYRRSGDELGSIAENLL